MLPLLPTDSKYKKSGRISTTIPHSSFLIPHSTTHTGRWRVTTSSVSADALPPSPEGEGSLLLVRFPELFLFPVLCSFSGRAAPRRPYWLLTTAYWLLATGYCLLATAYWLLTPYSLLIG